ncbi:MAG: hypothetical protein KF773_40195 [Deltaproteobacteria bacterium]|nr:hypothetical protein [Deltaproteobacteria bacterium]MCW5804355.1 hypothetical protein [Deltaproteobacteria bacterium]
MKRFNTAIVASLMLGAAACAGELDDDTNTPDRPPPGSTTGDEANTFDHDNQGYSPWDLIDRLAKEGPPKYTSHVHSCSKVPYDTLGRVLTSVGVNVASTTNLSAGQLYRQGFNALGGPNYANRIRENSGITTSGMSRMFDIFAAASDEIIANVPALERCTTAGAPAQLFDASNACQASGITCITGVPATAAHVDFCNLAVAGATDPAAGRRLAVAAMMAAAYTCL